MIKVLFVCLGNVCNSPSAVGIFKRILTRDNLEGQFTIESRGLLDYNLGLPASDEAIEASKRKQIDISSHIALPFQIDDLIHFDYIITLDNTSYDKIITTIPKHYANKVIKIANLSKNGVYKKILISNDDNQNIDDLLDAIEDACYNFLLQIKQTSFAFD